MRFSAAAPRPLTESPPQIRLSDGVDRLYAIGQVHSDVESLRALDARIASDTKGRLGKTTAVVQAGGLIDKGTTLPELLGYLRSRDRVGDARVTYLMGAHEALMARAVAGDHRAALAWLLSGAEGSLDRWGIPTADWVALLTRSVPRSDLEFLCSLPGIARVGDVRFVCSTFTESAARPFGLFGRPIDLEALFGPAPIVPIGRFSALMDGTAPAGWCVGDRWLVGRVACAVLERGAA